jgi:hypothetical protein
MAELPDYQPHENLPGPGMQTIATQSMVPVPSYDATAGAKALSGLGAELTTVAQKLEDGQQHTLASAGMSTYLQQRDKITQQYKNDPDFQNAETNAKSALGDAQSAALEGISDPKIRATAALEMTRSSISATSTVRDAQFTRQQGVNVGALDDVQQAARTDALNATSPVERQAALEHYGNEVKRVAAAGWIDNATAGKRVEDFERDLQTADAMKAIQLDPAKGKALLADAESFPLLTAVQRQQFMAAADTKDEADRTAQLQQLASFDPVKAIATLGRAAGTAHGNRIFSDGILGIETSGFDNSAVSPKGALGVSQIMPSTAREVAKGLGLNDIAGLSDADLKARLTSDADLNKRLGNTYFQQMLTRYNGNIPLAAAAYNAGPGRADNWKAQAEATFGSQFTAAQLSSIVDIKETKDYIGRLYGKLGAPMDFGFASATALQHASNTVDAVLQAQDAREQKVRSVLASTSDATTQINQMLKAGYDVDPQTIGNYRSDQQKAANGGDAEAIKRLRELDYSLAIQPLVRQAWATPPQVLDAAVQNLRAKITAPGANPSLAETRALEAFDSVLSEQKKTRDAEPVALGGANGGRYYTVQPLDPAAPLDDAMIGNLRDRDAQALTANRVYGGTGSPFLAVEADAWHQRYAQATPPDRAALLGALVKGLSPSTFSAALPQVVSGTNGKLDRPGVMMAAGLYGAAPEIAGSILQGIDAQNTESRYVPTAEANKLAYQTTKDQYLPIAAFNVAARVDPKGPVAAMQDGIDARYAFLSAQAKDTSGVVDRNRLQRAVDDVTGGVLWHNGAPVIAPARGMTQSYFDGVLWGLTDQDLAHAQTTSGKKIDADYLRGSAKLMTRSDGQYFLQINRNDANPQYASTPAGTPFVLDLRGRRPAAVPAADPIAFGGT